ncbi:MAG TPA: hypothetical protein VEL07_12555, partial [Planctomycetota bacterium]|nr:hypothetical protein [Planctomycetota bacterium]
MTLFEIAIALALVAVSITSVALLFPAGIRAQSAARFQLYAAAKAVELVDTFATTATVRPQVDGEAPVPWQVPLAYGAHLNDLERRVSSYRTGVFPLPQTIARRLDSDGDEIARLLDDGGRLSYSQALATTGMKDDAVPSSPPNEAQRLVFAVVGCAQLDAMPVFPWKAWPYYAAFPSPPAHGGHWNSPGFALEASPLPCDGVFAWEHTADPDIAA